MTGYLLILLMLSAIILIHESGHFLFMRLFGVPVVEVSIGLGPAIYQRTGKSGTIFSLRLIMLGGYAMPTREGADVVANKSFWQRLLIYSGGMLANAITAFVIIAGICLVFGTPDNWAAEVAWAPEPLRGLAFAFVHSFVDWFRMPYEFIVRFASIFDSVVGPVGIVEMGHEAVESSPTPLNATIRLLLLMANISTAIAGFNLIPFMPLDGGQIAVLLIEKLSGKYAPRITKVFTIVTASLILLLLVYVFGHDLWKLILKIF